MPDRSLSERYRQFADEAAPKLQAVLAGRVEIPMQSPSKEAWITYALYWGESQLSLEDLIRYADVVNHSIPNAEEIGWTLLALKKRRWLYIQKNSYRLTREGRRVVREVVGSGDLRQRIENLEHWVATHPVPIEERHEG